MCDKMMEYTKDHAFRFQEKKICYVHVINCVFHQLSVDSHWMNEIHLTRIYPIRDCNIRCLHRAHETYSSNGIIKIEVFFWMKNDKRAQERNEEHFQGMWLTIIIIHVCVCLWREKNALFEFYSQLCAANHSASQSVAYISMCISDSLYIA